jgi:hypothetical protein
MSRDPTESPAVAYNFSFEDFVAVRRALAWNGVFGRDTYWIRFAIIGVVLLACWAVPLAVYLKARAPSNWPLIAVVVALAGFTAYIIAMLALDLLVARFTFARLALANAKISLKFDVDGIHYVTPSYSGTLSWSGIRRVMTRPGYLLLFISKSEALVLPRRAFASDSAFGDIGGYVQTRTGIGEAR